MTRSREWRERRSSFGALSGESHCKTHRGGGSEAVIHDGGFWAETDGRLGCERRVVHDAVVFVGCLETRGHDAEKDIPPANADPIC